MIPQKTMFNLKRQEKMKSFKKISGLFYLCLIALILPFTLASCDDDDDDKVASVLKFSADKPEVVVGKTAAVTVSGGTAPYTVASSDQKIATVTVDKTAITITGVKVGTATIAVTDKNKIAGKISVTVKEAAAGLEFDKKTVAVDVAKEDIVTIKSGVAPYAAESKDSKIATVTVKDAKVTIKGVKAGTTTITVTDKDKKNSGTISVTVK